MLVDLSGMLKEAGVAVHFVHYGERKAEEGRAQLTGVKPELLGRIQSEIEQQQCEECARNSESSG